MHTPRPAPEPEAMLDVTNSLANDADGWAIFDQRSMQLASQNLNLGLDVGGGMGGINGSGNGNGNGNGSGMSVGNNSGNGNSSGNAMQGGFDGGISGIGVGGQVAMEYPAEWGMGGGEPYSDAWQNTLFRLFGNVEEMPSGNGIV
ncbi:hypothetical protein IFR05_016024 [Cadophora sp. M221]|nr:hypothetical protein IFR05_016024 [Cadophora sp. M221]